MTLSAASGSTVSGVPTEENEHDDDDDDNRCDKEIHGFPPFSMLLMVLAERRGTLTALLKGLRTNRLGKAAAEDTQVVLSEGVAASRTLMANDVDQTNLPTSSLCLL